MPDTFIEWNYETQKATEYQRNGECNMCGDCCRQLIFIKGNHIRVAEPIEDTCTKMGVEQPVFEHLEVEPRQDNDERKTYQFIVTKIEDVCPALTNENMCSAQKEKPSFCNVFPSRPKDLENLPNCSFEFEVVREWKFENGD